MGQDCCAHKKMPQKPDHRAYLVEKIRLYRPLIVLTALSLCGALALSLAGRVPFMEAMMGLFLCFIAALKFFDLKGFTTTFARYDVLAARLPLYGRTYPFIELSLGLLFLSGFFPVLTSLVLIAVMIIGNIGVFGVIRRGTVVQCGCVGTGFNLPVGRVTFAENTIMLLMGVMTLLHHL